MAEHDEIEIEDGSNDRAYFTLVPNIILNHSTATDQALYLQMKRFAGEKRGGSYCTASEKTLMAKLHIGREALKKSLAYLLERGWITFAGEKTVWTEGGPQKVKTYRVNDIWKMNVEHYKGVAESAPLKIKGVAETDKGVSETAKGVAETAPTKNYIKHIEPGALEDEQRGYEVITLQEEETTRVKKPPKYKNAKTVFSWFPRPEKNWNLNTTELSHAELLFERGEEEVKKRLRYVAEHEGEDFLPTINKPSDLERKWNDLTAYARRNS